MDPVTTTLTKRVVVKYDGRTYQAASPVPLDEELRERWRDSESWDVIVDGPDVFIVEWKGGREPDITRFLIWVP